MFSFRTRDRGIGIYKRIRQTFQYGSYKKQEPFQDHKRRRLTLGLEKFDRIIFDFAGVRELGQGFADELFRVFQARHPGIVLEVRNANSAVDFMIRRARA